MAKKPESHTLRSHLLTLAIAEIASGKPVETPQAVAAELFFANLSRWTDPGNQPDKPLAAAAVRRRWHTVAEWAGNESEAFLSAVAALLDVTYRCHPGHPSSETSSLACALAELIGPTTWQSLEALYDRAAETRAILARALREEEPELLLYVGPDCPAYTVPESV